MTECEVMDEQELQDFQPTQRQLLAKLKLHQYVPASIIGGLTPKNVEQLEAYLYPVTSSEVMRWHLDSKIFWFWFTLQNEQATALHNMKRRAVQVFNDILDNQIPDAKLASVQLKAAQMLLNITDKPTTTVTQNTMNISRDDVPRSLKKKSTVELQEELKRLEMKNNPN